MKRWLERPSLGAVAGAVAAWVVVVTALHVGVNIRRPSGHAAEARSLPVGGLPVT